MLVVTVYLNRFAASIDLNEKDPVVHKHTPYIVILVTLAAKWANSHNGCLPATRQEKKEFKVSCNVLISLLVFCWIFLSF